MKIKIIETEEFIEADSYCELLQKLNELSGTNYSKIDDIENFSPNPNAICEGTVEEVECCLIMHYLIGIGEIKLIINK
jgi:hypothetical protein